VTTPYAPDRPGTPIRIGIFDHDPTQARSLAAILNAYRCIRLRAAAELLSHREQFDLLVLDASTLHLPDAAAAPDMPAAAATAAAAITSLARSGIPILLIAARNQLPALEAARAAGASDYIVKPLRQSELLLRVQLLVKTAYPHHLEQQQIRFAQYVFETPSRRVLRDGTAIALTQKEFELALLLFGNLNRPLSRAYMQDAIWSGEPEIASRTLDTHISRIRNKLQLLPENGFGLTPVYGYGYQLEQLNRN
jgi:DNA-binding response OmpR family regulator